MTVKRESYGVLSSGEEVSSFRMTNRAGITARVMTYGATLTSLRLPQRGGEPVEITLGVKDIAAYEAGTPYFGCTVGRFGNRIAGGRFLLEGKTYTLARNDNNRNHLHGGNLGFDKVIWQAEVREETDRSGVTFSRLSPDGEEGYPGNLDVSVTYWLTETNELTIEYKATTSQTTPVNLTNHAYWNLSGAGTSILDHELRIPAESYLPVNNDLIPLGYPAPVAMTPMDFQSSHIIGRRIHEVPGGYDHCYLLRGETGELRPAAVLRDPASGRTLTITTTEPGIQFYSGNFLNGISGAEGKVFGRHTGLCLETQHYPDSVNQPAFPTTLLHSGDVYRHLTCHHFAW